MGDTDATPARATTGSPAAASTSSTPREPSPPLESVAALGERILTELGDDHTNNTLTRWLAHHTAALIEAADHAIDTGAADAEARAADARAAILQLWQYRSAWPTGWPPARAAAVVRLLDDLPDIESSSWHGASVLAGLQDLHHQIIAMLVDLAVAGGDNLEQGWLETFGDRLTPDEAAVLNRAASADHRVSRAFLRWQRTISAATDPGETENADTTDTESPDPAVAPRHPAFALVDIYHQTVLNLVGSSNDKVKDAAVGRPTVTALDRPTK